MTHPNGIHHFAICTADMKRQIEFFSDVLGMELVALYWMHGVPDTWHGFLKLNEQCSIALVQGPQMAGIATEIGKTHSGNAGAPSAPGTLQHIAFNVDTLAQLLTMRDRIRSYGVHVFGHIDHGFCKSIYFAGPENLSLEISTSEGQAINPAAWIDPEVVRMAGIGADELARFKSPRPFARPAQPVPQPAANSPGPRLVYPEKTYARMLAMSDEARLAAASETEPPVKPAPVTPCAW